MENLQYVAGVIVLLLGVFVIVGAAAAAVLKAMADAWPKKNEAGIAMADWELPKPIDVIRALLSGPITGAVVVGALIIWLGVCMTGGGTWLWFVELDNPEPA